MRSESGCRPTCAVTDPAIPASLPEWLPTWLPDLPILDRATWEQVCSRFTHAPIGRRPKVNLLAGMCRCAE
ncbi:MAG TPA: hypothetical protein PKA24_19475, partial [Microthrixaceae bacterium]|nr:hypothetical protein [Microthrixaceae bacterium]HMT63051.1 hypothetical protein [Microthrixaceae bacterium]